MVGVSATMFDPNATLSREQMAVLVARALKLSGTAVLRFSDDGVIAGWAQQDVEAAVAAGYLRGFRDGSFQPLATAKRAQAAKVLVVKRHVIDPGPRQGVDPPGVMELTLAMALQQGQASATAGGS